MSDLVVEFENVSKTYRGGWFATRRVQALDQVSFAVRQGQVFGLLGPNRAGKTTAVKLLLNLTRPSEGLVRRFGQPATAGSTLARVGYIHESPAFPKYLSADAFLRYCGALGFLSEEGLNQRIPRLLERFGLADRQKEPIGNFSKGMLQRLGFAQALLNEPELLVLDEPNEGLDLEGRRLCREVLQEYRAKGHTVILVSHLLPDVEALCDHFCVFVKGKVAYLGEAKKMLLTQSAKSPHKLEDALANLYRMHV